MGNTQELRFQGLCLVNTEGYLHMCRFYDKLPDPIRDRLKLSNYNLCAACVVQEAWKLSCICPPTVPDYLKTIEAMEQELKRQELVEAGWRIIA